MPVLDRQAPRSAPNPATTPSPRTPTTATTASTLPPSLAGLPARSVPEVAPTPLQRHYINLSVIVLVCGAIAITALELGTPLGSPLIKLCVLVGAPLLLITTADALVRIWRSAWAWMPVDRGRALFRLAWLIPAFVFILLILGAVALVLGA